MSKVFIILGICFLALGFLWSVGPKIPVLRHLGHLSGDIAIEKESFHFYFPLVSCIVVSVGLTLLVQLIRFVSSLFK